MFKAASNFVHFCIKTRVTPSISTIIYHILITWHGFIDICLSDHHLVYCSRKFSKTESHKQITCSLKYYTVDVFNENYLK